jgi:hypothetical protein
MATGMTPLDYSRKLIALWGGNIVEEQVNPSVPMDTQQQASDANTDIGPMDPSLDAAAVFSTTMPNADNSNAGVAPDAFINVSEATVNSAQHAQEEVAQFQMSSMDTTGPFL